MARKATGKPGGRPVVPLHAHPCRAILAFADSLHWLGGMSRQKAYLLLTAFMTAVSVEAIPFDEMSRKMQRAFKEQGGIAMRFTLPAKGN